MCVCVAWTSCTRRVWPMPKVVKSISLHFYEAPTVWHMASKHIRQKTAENCVGEGGRRESGIEKWENSEGVHC